MKKKIDIEKKVLSRNDELAAELRRKFNDRKILTLNLVSSPGSGKTSLLEKTLEQLKDKLNMVILAGDVQTENDAQRLIEAGGETVRSITTGGACHLDAKMVGEALEGIRLDAVDVLFIENVGNLVCPSGFDLGEDMKVALISVTEGDDKPLKYPAMFRKSSALIINKTDLLEHCDFDMDELKGNAGMVNPDIEIMEISCRSGAGLETWYKWLVDRVGNKKTV